MVIPKFNWEALQRALQFYINSSLCCIPVPWGKKKYDFYHAGNQGWEKFQVTRPNRLQLDKWFNKDTPTGIAIVCGGVSNGMVALCFNTDDGPELFFGKERWEMLLSRTYVVKTQRGYHVYLRSSTKIKSQNKTKDGQECWLEIRSDGNYIIAPPSLHPSGIPYTNIGREAIYTAKDLSKFLAERCKELGLKDFVVEGDTPPPKEKPKTVQPEGADKSAVDKLMESCAFMQYCRDNAASLSEPYWWSEGQILSFFGEPGREKYHELSSSYQTAHSKYTERETNDKFEEAVRAGSQGIAPHRCDTIQQSHGFACPEDCLAKKWKIKSPAGLARVLVEREESNKYLIAKTNAKGEVVSIKVDQKKLIEDLKQAFTFKSVFGFVRDDILIYQNGVYTVDGEKRIREECEIRVPPPYLTTHTCHEIRDRIAGTTFADREKFNTEKYIINLQNGLLNIKTRELMPHTPAFLSTVRIPVTYDPQAKCPKIEGFLADILRPEDIKIILEFFGYALIPDYSIPVVLILLGEGSNGKTQLLRLLGQFIGQGNCVSVSLQDIENTPFAVANLEGKLLNMQGDLSSKWLSGIGMLKQLSGLDRITANRKYKDPLYFDNVSRLVFASNKPPEIEEDTLAVWRRILPLDLPNTFQGGEDIKNFVDTIVSPQEMSGLLNLALDSLKQLLSKGDFSYQGDYSDRARQYTVASKPARVFAEECCDAGVEHKILKEELYKAYEAFCNKNRVQLSGESQFGKDLRQVPGLNISDKKYQEKGVRVRWWLGIRLKGKEDEQIDMEV